MKFLKGTKDLIQLEVILGFSLVFAILGSAAVINFYSINKLVKAVTTISQQDKILISLRQLTNQLSDEEKAVRSYSISKEQKYLDAYNRSTDSLHLSVARLKLYTLENNRQSNMADSVSNFVAAREGLYSSYIEKRKVTLGEEINNDKYTLPVSDSGKKNKGKSTAVADTAPAKEKNKISSFFKNVFGSGDKQNKAEAANKNSPDNRSYHPQEVNDILDQQMADIQQQWQSWSLDELLLLQQDKVLMDNLRKSIHNLEEDEMSIVRHQADDANRDAYSAIKMISAISAIGLICILIIIYFILAEVTKRNKLRYQLVEERKKAEKLAKVKEEFLANMSHEIRTPLNAIIGFTEQILKADHDDKEKRFLHAIEHSSDHLLSIVNQILDYSRLEAGKMQQSEVAFNFGVAVREVYELFRIKSSSKNIWLSYHINENLPPDIVGDEVSYKQILINLVNNAVKFTEKGSVEIICTLDRNEDGKVYINTEVKDTGQGIPYDMQDKIFDEFTQGDAEITRKYGGTGLGLAITLKLVKMLNGKISVRSRVNEGASFAVIIPFKVSTAAVTPQEKKLPQVLPHFINKSVLIVDDEEMNLMLGKTILENWNIRVETALNAAEAIDKFAKQHFDLILLDIQMPGTSGLELSKIIRNINSEYARTVPILALTANIYNDFSPSEFGINDILIKPFKEKELLQKIDVFWDTNLEKFDVNDKENHNGKMNENVSELSYDLSFLTSTSGSNPEFVKKMIQSFIQNNWDNITKLNKAVNEDDYNFIRLHAHKMIPSYRYLRINKTEKELKLLEKLAEEKAEPGKISELVCMITEDTHHVINLLTEEIEKFGSPTITQGSKN